MNDNGVVNIHGKDYYTVARRIHDFRELYPHWSITTELLSSGDNVIMKSTIADQEGGVISTGYAEEVRGSTNINKTSAIENCETSCVGRALAFMGLAGTEIASADEVANAITQQNEKALYERFVQHTKAVNDCIGSIMTIQDGIRNGNLESAAEAWNELTDDEKKALWLAPTKGGIFSTHERKVIQSDEFAAIRRSA